jgi:hypothetical protein
MKIKLFVITALVLFSLAISVSEARACEPCTRDASLKFEETARRADLIVLGRRDDFSPEELTHGVGGPANIKLKVSRVLKGEEAREEITVKSWSGMCPYGIVINDNLEHVVFLKKSGETYVSVAECAVKYYDVKDGQVEFEKQKIAVEDFEIKLREIGLRKSDSSDSGVFPALYRVIVGGKALDC